jgi:5-methylcytosine-specific restriction protein B
MIMLDERIKRDLAERYEAMLARNELFSRVQLDAYYATFRRRFGPDVLANLDGAALLTTMHEHGNRDSLVYWLEFKRDEELPSTDFGSIAGGSALKFGIYKRNETGAWMTGSPQHQREIAEQEAVTIARRNRDQLLAGVKLLERLPDGAGDAEYARLQADLAQAAPDLVDTAWGHKYFSLLFPEKLDDYHSPVWQRFHLIKLLELPPEQEGRYVCAGRFVRIMNEVGMPMNHLAHLLNERDGNPHRYWRVLANYSDHNWQLWDTMRRDGCVAIGWSQLGDLSELKYDQASRDRVQSLMKEHYNSPGRWAYEVFWFASLMAEGDLVLAFEQNQVIGAGRVTGGYRFVPDSRAPHQRLVQWLSDEKWKLPETEAVASVARELKFPQNMIEVERRLLYAPTLSLLPPTPVLPGSGPHVVPTLAGVLGRIQAVLDRKRQVILYGPPGTGKTFRATLAACDLAAFAAFGAAFEQLDLEQQAIVLGNGEDKPGLVRMCTFHPAYGYEDFMEGYRPVPADGGLGFELRAGIFKRVCEDAGREPAKRFFLLIDEINRGDIPRIFGELLTVLERDKRGRLILLPLSGHLFSVPDNVYLIGTMNTADRSIALLDTALRRRFGFVELMPESRVLGNAVINGIPLGPWLDALNRRICEHVGRDARNLQVGHAYLMDGGSPVADFARFTRIVQDDIIPLLEEYCYEDYDALEKLLGPGLVDRAVQRIRHELFDPTRQEDLVAALLAPAPDIATSFSATIVEIEGPSEEPGEDEENAGNDRATAS